MLTILLGTDWVANRDEIFRMIAQDVSQRKGNRLLLVPELISHDTERRLALTAGDTASRYAQVVSFSRLVRFVSEFCETAPMSCLDKGGRVVAMAAAVRQLNNKLKSYAAVLTRPEFYAGLLDAWMSLSAAAFLLRIFAALLLARRASSPKSWRNFL